MEFLEDKHDEIIANLLAYFSEQILREPGRVLHQVERELEALYVHFGNDWTGRGAVADATQAATIAGLEAVRAECLAYLEDDRELSWQPGGER